MCEQFGVSKSTIRETLRMLQRDGLVRSVNGVGSFVTRVLHSDLGRLVTTKSLINGAGFADKVEDCRISLTTHSPEWEERFEAPGPFVMIERTRSAEGQPIVRSLNVLPQAVCGDAFGTTLEGSLLEFLEKKLCIRISYSFSEIAVPRKDNLRDAAALALLGEETLLLRQMHFDEHDRAIFYSFDYMDNRRIKFFIRRNRTAE
ncbi:GntR family transcriptional regulator [Yanshouia hominis]|nr:GntR family transcriptional regulator [Yanshouia hominis]